MMSKFKNTIKVIVLPFKIAALQIVLGLARTAKWFYDSIVGWIE